MCWCGILARDSRVSSDIRWRKREEKNTMDDVLSVKSTRKAAGCERAVIARTRLPPSGSTNVHRDWTPSDRDASAVCRHRIGTPLIRRRALWSRDLHSLRPRTLSRRRQKLNILFGPLGSHPTNRKLFQCYIAADGICSSLK